MRRDCHIGLTSPCYPPVIHPFPCYPCYPFPCPFPCDAPILPLMQACLSRLRQRPPGGMRTGLLRRVTSRLLRRVTPRVLRRVTSRRLCNVTPLGLPIAHGSLLHIASAASARCLGHVAACLLHRIAPSDLGRIAARDLRRVAPCSPCDLRRIAPCGLCDVGAWLHGGCDTELLEAEESRGRERWAEAGERGARLIQRDAATAGLKKEGERG